MTRLRAVLADRLYLSALGVVLVLVLCVTYLFAAVLDEPLTDRPDVVTVELRQTGGLFEGSAVTYRGVKVGRVATISKTPQGVEAQIRLDGGAQVPADTRAVVRSLSPVGEQYLDFQPSSSEGPYLADGSTVAAESTDLPRSLASTVIAVNDVLRQVDDRKLRSLLVEISEGLAGTGDDLGLTVERADLLLAELDRVRPQTDRLLRNGDTVLDIGVDHAGDLEQLATSARQLARFLRNYDPELRRTLRRAPGQLRQLDRLLDDVREVVPGFLEAGVSLTDIFAAHDPHLRALLQAYAPGLSTLGDVVRDGALQLELIVDQDARCRYDTPRRDPRDVDRQPMPRDAGCAASFSALQRGAAHAPGPTR